MYVDGRKDRVDGWMGGRTDGWTDTNDGNTYIRHALSFATSAGFRRLGGSSGVVVLVLVNWAFVVAMQKQMIRYPFEYNNRTVNVQQQISAKAFLVPNGGGG